MKELTRDPVVRSIVTLAARGRVPPHDLDAEKAVLGAIFLDNTALSLVEGFLRADDFYHPANATVYGAAQALAARGAPVDIVTLAAELRALDRLHTIGGAQYLGELTDVIPSISHVESHARIVVDLARVRGMIGAAEEVVTRGYTDYGKAEDFLSTSAAKVFEAAAGRGDHEPVSLETNILDAFARLEATVTRGVRVTGVETGFRDLDTLTAGMHGGQLLILAARPAMGKAQPVDTPVLTPAGWRPLGEVRVGDRVIGAAGQPVTVRGVYPQGVRPCFRVTASDGASTRCDAEHLWAVRTRAQAFRGEPCSVFSLDLLVHLGLTCDLDGGDRWHLPVLTRPVQYDPPTRPPLGPEALAAYLRTGDVADADRDALVALGLADKRPSQRFVPEVFLRAEVDVRARLLAALVRPDPRLPPARTYEFVVFSYRFGRDLLALARSLGGVASFVGGDQDRLTSGLVVRMSLPPPLGAPAPGVRLGLGPAPRTVRRVEPCEEAEMVCLAVDAPDQLYVTEDFLVTHNTSFALNLTVHAAVSTGKPVLFFSLEMPRIELTQRALCAEARVDQSRLRAALLSGDDVTALTAAANKLHTLPVFIDDTGDLTLVALRAKARRMKQQRGLSLVVLDYLQLLHGSGDGRESREREVAEMSRGLKALAKELDVPILALSQLNRGCETRPGKDKRPRLADLRESGAIEQDSDVVMFIYRDEVYNKDTEDRGVAEIILAKQRNGPTDTVRLRFVRELTRFEDLARDAPPPHDFGEGPDARFEDGEPAPFLE